MPVNTSAIQIEFNQPPPELTRNSSKCTFEFRAEILSLSRKSLYYCRLSLFSPCSTVYISISCPYSAIFSKIYIQSSLPPTITIKSFGLKETTISDKRFIKREIVERQPGWSRKRQYDIYNAYRYRGSYPNHLIVPTGCTANYSDWEVDLIEEVDF